MVGDWLRLVQGCINFSIRLTAGKAALSIPAGSGDRYRVRWRLKFIAQLQPHLCVDHLVGWHGHHRGLGGQHLGPG